jgi:hypothetical protein
LEVDESPAGGLPSFDTAASRLALSFLCCILLVRGG